MRIEGPKIEVSNLEGAIQGSKIIQIIWFNLLWCILLGPQLSPVSSVLLLDIIFIDWLKVRTGRSKVIGLFIKIQSKKTSSMNPEFLRRLEVTRTFFLRYIRMYFTYLPCTFFLLVLTFSVSLIIIIVVVIYSIRLVRVQQLPAFHFKLQQLVHFRFLLEFLNFSH